jgi:nicotinamidase-related amidase
MHRRTLCHSGVLLLGGTLVPELLNGPEAGAAGKTGRLTLKERLREPQPGADSFVIREKQVEWEPRETALIICDMWDDHWCRGASRRTGEVAPHIDRFAAEARKRGVLIVHAPSACMEFYKDHPGRKLAQNAPAAADLPKDIAQWCRSIPAEEKGVYPIDQTDGGCDDEPKCETGNPWKRQIASIDIRDEDAISDSGVEIWNLFALRGIRNVLLCGVHTNMCVLGRPFGLRNMARFGKNTALVRDLTDTMYNSRARPYVNHFRGTDLIVEHIEKYVCPTVTSDQLVGGKPFRFKEDRG